MKPQQGPNYMFAKRLQHWRAMVAAAAGAVVSSNVAPASITQSVIKNKLLAAAFKGASLIPPLYIFHPQTSNALLTYLLLHDLRSQSAGNRPQGHPLTLFSSTAVHNGSWTCAFQLRSVLEAVVFYHYIRETWAPGLGFAAFLAALAFQSRSTPPWSRM